MKERAGFSLMEILIAMVLLGGVAAFTLNAFTSATQITSSDTGIAYNVGRGVLERMYEFVRQDQWATANLPLSTTSPGTSGPFQPQNSTKTLGVDNTEYRTVYTVSEDPGSVGEDFRRVNLTVCWDQAGCP